MADCTTYDQLINAVSNGRTADFAYDGWISASLTAAASATQGTQCNVVAAMRRKARVVDSFH